MRTIQLMSLILALAIGWSGIGYAQNTSPSEAYNAVMKTLEELKPDETIKVVIGTQKQSYEVGEPFEARFQADQPCYMTLMDISTSGDLAFLAPSQYFPNAQIEENRVYSTSGDFGLNIKVSDPTGYETLNIFCTREPFDFFKADLKKEAVYTIPANDATRLKELQKRLEELQGVEWAGTSTTFEIIPKGKAARGSQNIKKRGMLEPIDATGSTGRMLWPVDATGSTGHTEDDEKPKSNE